LFDHDRGLSPPREWITLRSTGQDQQIITVPAHSPRRQAITWSIAGMRAPPPRCASTIALSSPSILSRRRERAC